jgi:hypothetical protein
MMGPVGFALLSQKGTELLMNFNLNHKRYCILDELHCDTNPLVPPAESTGCVILTLKLDPPCDRAKGNKGNTKAPERVRATPTLSHSLLFTSKPSRICCCDPTASADLFPYLHQKLTNWD